MVESILIMDESIDTRVDQRYLTTDCRMAYSETQSVDEVPVIALGGISTFVAGQHKSLRMNESGPQSLMMGV
jgi:hypothetical protein